MTRKDLRIGLGKLLHPAIVKGVKALAPTQRESVRLRVIAAEKALADRAKSPEERVRAARTELEACAEHGPAWRLISDSVAKQAEIGAVSVVLGMILESIASTAHEPAA